MTITSQDLAQILEDHKKWLNDDPCGKRANLSSANLSGADLSGAYLYGAYLYGAYLAGAYLRSAYLSGADLTGADLTGAKISEGYTLIGLRPFFQLGPIGSRNDHLLSFITDKGIMIKAGCFFGTIEEFKQAVNETHTDNNHKVEYLNAVNLIEIHASLWEKTND